jgi:hypothetical protein
MTRLVLCIFILSGTVAFLSCGDSLDGGNTTGVGGRGGTYGGDGAGPGGRGGFGACGYQYCDGSGPVAGTGWSDGAGPVGGTTGGGGRGGFIGGDGIGPVAGRGGGSGGGPDGGGPVGGRGGTGGCPAVACDGTGPIAGRGGTSGTGTGGTGSVSPCAGLAYFLSRGLCASTYDAQVAKQVPGNCDYVRVLTGTCGGLGIWATRYSSVGDPVVCAYNGVGGLAGARICTDVPMPAWNCNGAATSPNCLTAGTVPDIQSCTMAGTCGGPGAGGRGGAGGVSGSGGCVTGCDGTGPISGRGGSSQGDGAFPIAGRGGA